MQLPGTEVIQTRSAVLVLLLLSMANVLAEELNTRNVILVTLDGVRTEEIFSGVDQDLAAASGKQAYSEIELVRERFQADSADARRKKLLPFFWGTLAPSGMVFGNQERGSRVLVTNAIKWSTPGYSEILTGVVDPAIVDNSPVRYPNRTVPEYLVEALELPKSKVAQFGSWDGFKYAAASEDDAFVMNGAYDPLPPGLSTPVLDAFVAIRREVMGLWEESSNDAITFRIAMSYLETHEPRFMWLGLGQSDDWAHADRYDRLLDYLHLADSWLADLWAFLEEHPAYAGKTTLIVTTDHGRGRTASDWMEHDESIPGSESIWIAIIGPDTPALGERVTPGTVHQADFAATMLALLRLDPAEFNPDAGPPLPGVTGADEH